LSLKPKQRKDITAVEARARAQEIAFAPLVFQCAVSLRDLGILDMIIRNKQGIGIPQIARKLNLSEYGVATLLEMAACADIVHYLDEDTVAITKVGYMIHADAMTKVNINFVNDVCYHGAAYLKESILKGRPAGLKTLGPWKTVYQGLSKLPPKVRKSWFEFDHYYSDAAFQAAAKIVLDERPSHLLDIGGNTGKWSVLICRSDKNVRVTILDLPGQLRLAERNVRASGCGHRVDYFAIDLLNPRHKIPKGADAIWMSQFLDCFSEEEIVSILKNVRQASSSDTWIYILEPFIDNQKFEAAEFCLTGTSLYFTIIANGNSKMYRSTVMKRLVEKAGLSIEDTFELLDNSHHTLLKCRKKK